MKLQNKIDKIDITSFKKETSFYEDISLLLTIKSFDLKAIRERYIKSKNSTGTRTGSVERREVTIGGIVKLKMGNGNVIEEEILVKLPEPRGIDAFDNLIGLSSENKVYIIDKNSVKYIEDPWFSYIHTVNFHRKNPEKIIVSSSGFDAIFEYDYIKQNKTFEWFAWENGFNQGLDPVTGQKFYLTRREDIAKNLESEGKEVLYINNPKEQVLPTAKRAAFINSVLYDEGVDGKIIATFFHKGAVYSIDRETGVADKLIDGLRNPHGGRRFGEKIMATSTSDGRVVTGSLTNQTQLFFNKLPGKPEYLSELEWLQNSIFLNNNIITIDSNRNAFIIVNMENKLYDVVPFNDNWAIQDLIESKPTAVQIELIKKIGM